MAKAKEVDSEGINLGEFGNAIMQIADEKGIPRETVIEIVEAALAAAYKKDYGKKSQRIKAKFDEKTGDTKFFLVKEVIDETNRVFIEPGEEGEEMEEEILEEPAEGEEGEEKKIRFNPERDMVLEEAKKLNDEAELGDTIEIELETQQDYGRIAAQTAKQVIIQRIREAERDSMYSEYKEKEHQVISGVVQRIEGFNVFIDLGKSIGLLPLNEQVKGERYRIGQRVRVYLLRVESDTKGPGITLSRTHPELIRKLFELEVPEIFSGIVEIKSIAREAGSRTKIAVYTEEEGVDPIGSCVGQKGIRVQTVIDELGGEKIDIIEWSDDVEKFIATALSPAQVLSVEIKNEENKEAVAKVMEDQLSLAIGRKGQNVRLAAKLTGWKIDVVSTKPGSELKEVEGEKESETEEEAKSE